MNNRLPIVLVNGKLAMLAGDDTMLLPVVTAARLLGVDGNRAVVSVNLAAFFRSICTTITIQDDGNGGVTITMPDTINVKLLGDNDATITGSATATAWNGTDASTTWTAIWKAAVVRLEAIRVLLAGTVKVDGSAVTQPVRQLQFMPASGSFTTKIAAKNTTMSGFLPTGTTAIMVYNSTAVLAFVRWGTGLQSATINDMPLQAGANMIFGKASANDTLAVILASGTGNVYVTCGALV